MSTALTVATTTSMILKKDLHTPFSGDRALRKIRGLLHKYIDTQQTAVGAPTTSKYVSRTEGKVLRVLIGLATAAAAGETMVYDIQVNGTSIFTSTPQAGASLAAGLYDATGLVAAHQTVKVGDVISFVRTYTPGGGATMTENDISLEVG